MDRLVRGASGELAFDALLGLMPTGLDHSVHRIQPGIQDTLAATRIGGFGRVNVFGTYFKIWVRNRRRLGERTVIQTTYPSPPIYSAGSWDG
jgi:hypothetical protein